MPKRTLSPNADTPHFDGKTVMLPGGEQMALADFLQRAEPFYFSDDLVILYVRPEVRRRRVFWYGYRRYAGRLSKVYLGKSESLAGEKIIAAAWELERKA